MTTKAETTKRELTIGIKKMGRKYIPWFKINNQTFNLETWTSHNDAQTYLDMLCIGLVNLQPRLKINT